MQSRGSNARLSGMAFRSRISTLMLSMLATFASIYVAGRLWQDAENRVSLIKELDRRTGQGQSTISVDETLKVIACKDQQKRLSALEMELAAARHEGFVSKYLSDNNETRSRKKLLAVIGSLHSLATRIIGTQSGDHGCQPVGYPLLCAARKKLEEDKGIILRFVIGRSANRGDNLDKAIDSENRQTNDFIIIDNHIEALEELPKKTKSFFVHAADTWDAEFYAKVNDDIYVNIDALGTMLANHWDKPRVYLGCMKSGEVFSEPGHKWYEPDWWKFGDGKSYLRHASGEMFVISRALAQFISINREILCTYAHDDVSAGSWFIGLDVKYVDEGKLCCSSSWTSGAICGAV